MLNPLDAKKSLIAYIRQHSGMEIPLYDSPNLTQRQLSIMTRFESVEVARLALQYAEIFYTNSHENGLTASNSNSAEEFELLPDNNEFSGLQALKRHLHELRKGKDRDGVGG